MTPATLPRELTIDGIVHITHWRTHNHVVLQNYTLPVQSSQEPMANDPQVAGQNMFHVHRVIQHDPGEELGDKLGSFTDLEAAMNFVAKEEQLA